MAFSAAVSPRFPYGWPEPRALTKYRPEHGPAAVAGVAAAAWTADVPVGPVRAAEPEAPSSRPATDPAPGTRAAAVTRAEPNTKTGSRRRRPLLLHRLHVIEPRARCRTNPSPSSPTLLTPVTTGLGVIDVKMTRHGGGTITRFSHDRATSNPSLYLVSGVPRRSRRPGACAFGTPAPHRPPVARHPGRLTARGGCHPALRREDLHARRHLPELDNNGNPVTPAEAKQIVAERWTVPEEIRKRRRSRKIAGRAPQAATTGPDSRDDPPGPRSSRPRPKTVNPAT